MAEVEASPQIPGNNCTLVASNKDGIALGHSIDIFGDNGKTNDIPDSDLKEIKDQSTGSDTLKSSPAVLIAEPEQQPDWEASLFPELQNMASSRRTQFKASSYDGVEMLSVSDGETEDVLKIAFDGKSPT